MTDQQPPPGPEQPRVPDPSISQPPAAPIGVDRSGWSQPPAPQTPGPPGAFKDRPGAPPGQPLPPGAGSPVAPGPAMSVREPIKDTAINLGAVLMFAGIVIVLIIVIAVLIAVLRH